MQMPQQRKLLYVDDTEARIWQQNMKTSTCSLSNMLHACNDMLQQQSLLFGYQGQHSGLKWHLQDTDHLFCCITVCSRCSCMQEGQINRHGLLPDMQPPRKLCVLEAREDKSLT